MAEDVTQLSERNCWLNVARSFPAKPSTFYAVAQFCAPQITTLVATYFVNLGRKFTCLVFTGCAKIKGGFSRECTVGWLGPPASLGIYAFNGFAQADHSGLIATKHV